MNRLRIPLSILLLIASIVLFGGTIGYLIYSSYRLEEQTFRSMARPALSTVFFGLAMKIDHPDSLVSDIREYIEHPEEADIPSIQMELKETYRFFERMDTLMMQALQAEGVNLIPDFAMSIARMELRDNLPEESADQDLTNDETEWLLFGNRTLMKSDHYLGFYKWTGDIYFEIRLYVSYPGLWKYLLAKTGWQLAGILTAGLLMLGIFLYTMQTMLKQKKLSEMKNDFINNITHELNTPISTIRISGQTLLKDQIKNDPSMVTDLTNTILRQNKRLQETVERVILQTKGFRDGEVLKKKPLHLHALLRKILADFRLSVEVPLEMNERLEADDDWIWGEESSLSGAIINVLDNACKYSGGAIRTDVSTWNRNGRLGLRIADEGIGIPVREQKKVFEKFYRVGNNNRHEVKGLGLGLFYVKQVMDAHGAEIMLESVVNRGTSLTFYFPPKNEAHRIDS